MEINKKYLEARKAAIEARWSEAQEQLKQLQERIGVVAADSAALEGAAQNVAQMLEYLDAAPSETPDE